MHEDNNGNAAPEPEMFPLDEAAIESIQELDAQEKRIIDAAKEINVARQAILSYFLRQHKMTGNWTLAENRKELTRNPEPAPVPTN